jgi:hypothetical protein
MPPHQLCDQSANAATAERGRCELQVSIEFHKGLGLPARVKSPIPYWRCAGAPVGRRDRRLMVTVAPSIGFPSSSVTVPRSTECAPWANISAGSVMSAGTAPAPTNVRRQNPPEHISDSPQPKARTRQFSRLSWLRRRDSSHIPLMTFNRPGRGRSLAPGVMTKDKGLD